MSDAKKKQTKGPAAAGTTVVEREPLATAIVREVAVKHLQQKHCVAGKAIDWKAVQAEAEAIAAAIA